MKRTSEARLTDALRARIASRLPEGYDAANLRILTASAVILGPETEETPLEAKLAEEMSKAGVPKITEGRPTIMRIVAWVAHEGMNRNRLSFRKEDLEAAALQIGEPNFLPMDFNHSAVDPYDQRVIGVWYHADYAHNPKARDGVGAWGLRARGVLWSALFPEQSTKLLAEQARNGHMEFSMACIPQSTEIARDADGRVFEIAHKPVFFTFSALDIRPGDPDARGLGEEGSQDPELETRLEQELQQAADAPEALATALLAWLRSGMTDLVTASHQEEGMDELLKFLQAQASKMADKETLEAIETKVAALVDAAKAQADQTEARQALETKVAELTDRIATLETALDAAKQELATASTKIEEQNTALAERDAELAKVHEREAEEARTARLATRVAELPEHVRAAHLAQADEKRVETEARWASKTDEEWQALLADFALVPRVAKSYLQRSEEEGRLPGGTSGKSVRERLAAFKN